MFVPREAKPGAQSARPSVAAQARDAASPSLVVGRRDDPLEHEADRVAARVLTRHGEIGGVPMPIQRDAMRESGQTQPAPDSVARTLASPGSPLELPLRRDMQRRFGRDFSRVRVHDTADAARSARDLDAQSYTAGTSIAFAAGAYRPMSVAGRGLIAHELAHVVQQSGQPATAAPTVRRSPADGSGVARESPAQRPDDMVVKGVTYHPVWDEAAESWDMVDPAGRSLYSSVVSGEAPDPLAAAKFWMGVASVGAALKAKKMAADAVTRMIRERGPELAEIERNLEILRKPGWQENLDGQERRLAARRGFEAKRQEILDAYDPSVQRSSPAPGLASPRVYLPYQAATVPLHGPPEPHFPAYAADIVPDKGKRFGKYGGLDYAHDAVRSSVGDAYAYDIETYNAQVANDLERIARAGYTEIHIATGTHGGPEGGLAPEYKFLREDARSIMETAQRHPGLRIVAYNMADPVQVAKFNAMQALAANGSLPGGATLDAYCYSRTRVFDPNESPAGPYGTVEVLGDRGPMAPRFLLGGLSVLSGVADIHAGLNDPNPRFGAAKVVAGGAQVVGGVSYAAGYAKDSLGVVRFGSRLSAVGGAASGVLTWIDVARDMRSRIEQGAVPMTGQEALYHGVDDTLKLASAFFPEAALAALAINYGVKPLAEKAAAYVTPTFVGAISEIYDIPSWRHF